MTCASPKLVQVITNLGAGGYNGAKVGSICAAFEKLGARVVLTHSGPGESLRIDDDASHICAVGGDGTIRHVAMALERCGRPRPMSIYPGGTVNLLHREAPAPTDPSAFARHVLGAEFPRNCHAVRLNDTLFLACASVGPDSAAVASLSPGLKRYAGRIAYAYAFAAVLLNWKRHPITLQYDSRTLPCEAFYVAKSRHFAGTWSFAPKAQLHDAFFHVVALSVATRRSYARFLWLLATGGAMDRHANAVCFTCTSLTARSPEPLPVQADGDIVASLPIELNLHSEPIVFH